MEDRIRNAIETLSVAEIDAAVQSTEERLDLCIENNGRHFEHLRK